MALAVRPSPIHSVGVYTSTPIRKKTRVVEYDGERITAEEADRRYNGVSRTYLYGLDDGKTVIDGHGLGAYLNHSCDPNCEVDEIKGRVWIFAIRDIAAGEELLWDYNLYDDEDPAPCHCGSPKCRGTMYSREWMAKLRRREARKKKKLESAEIGKSATRDSTTRKGATVKSTIGKGTTVDNMTGKGTTSSRADSVPLDEAGFSR
ncbi:MAG: SET domain-containing protein-lysine N-methyltransferase [Candidatus Sulfotelmatobacter sp.]|jgi:hypothetical protein